MNLRDLLFGRPLPTEDDDVERVGPIVGVPILGLDALASASYGPEALLTVLLTAAGAWLFSHGIVALGGTSAVLLIVFRGITDALIPLFAVGALLAFTMSQAGMVIHWQKRRSQDPHARRSLLLNALGATATGVTLCIVLVSKFAEGAWLSVLLVVAMFLLFRQVHRHYAFIAKATATEAALDLGPVRPPLAIVPLRRWDAVSVKALQFALGISPEVVAVQVLTENQECDVLTDRWAELTKPASREAGGSAPALVVLRSPFRDLYGPLLNYVRQRAEEQPQRQVAVIVSQLVEARWYHALLHHAASFLKARLLQLGNPQLVVINTPWYLHDWVPERQRLFHPQLRESASEARTAS